MHDDVCPFEDCQEPDIPDVLNINPFADMADVLDVADESPEVLFSIREEIMNLMNALGNTAKKPVVNAFYTNEEELDFESDESTKIVTFDVLAGQIFEFSGHLSTSMGRGRGVRLSLVDEPLVGSGRELAVANMVEGSPANGSVIYNA